MNIMKRIFLIIIFLFITFSIQSQVLIALLLGDKLNSGNIEFGLDGGYNYSKVSGFDANKKLSEFNLGFYFDIKMKENWYLNTGLLVKSTLGIDDEILAEGLSVYPNPAINSFTINSKLPIEKVEIFSVLGKKITEINTNFKSISTENLARGIYMVKVYSEKGVAVRKIIKQ